jgi:hypothetical protein
VPATAQKDPHRAQLVLILGHWLLALTQLLFFF